MALRLKQAGESLGDYPERGRQAGNLRELAVVPPYLIRYRVMGSGVQIIRIRHSAQSLE